MKKKKMIGITVLLLAIGFAAVSTTLVITGVIGVGVNDDFSVIFTKALLNGEVSEKAVISADKKTITFTTDKMTMVDETQVLDYTVKNNSTQYDANVTINCTNLQSEYVTVVNTLDGTNITTDNETYMEAQESKDGDITITMIKPYIEDEDTDLSITCNIVAEAVPRDDEVEPGDGDDDEPTLPDTITIKNDDNTPSTTPVKVVYDDGTEETVTPSPNGVVTPTSGKRLTGIFFASDSECNLLLGTCNNAIASRSGKLYDIVKSQNLGDVSKMNFDFSSYSDQTNGRGVYSTKETQTGETSYFYRGDVKNNNIRVGNTCWLIMHTTDGKGTKLLYNGLYRNGCGIYYVENVDESTTTLKLSATRKYYYSTSYSFDNKTGNFSLNNPVNDYASNDYAGYYLTTYSGATSNLYEVVSYDESITTFTVKKHSQINNNYAHIGATSSTSTAYNKVATDQTFNGYMTAIDADSVNTSGSYSSITLASQGLKMGEVGTHYVIIYKTRLGDYSISDKVDIENLNSNIPLVNPTTCTNCNPTYFVGKYVVLPVTYGVEAYFVGDYVKEDSDYYYFEGAQVFTTGEYYTNTKSEAEASSNIYDSTIKKVVDTWYENNLKGTTYESLLEDAIYCNDRSVADDVSNINPLSSATLLFQNAQFLANNTEERNRVVHELFGGFGKNYAVYSSVTRITNYTSRVKPTYKCLRKVDSFNVSDASVGNGRLKYPIALASGDELSFAGIANKGTAYTDSYAAANMDFWTMTPGMPDSNAWLLAVSYGSFQTGETVSYTKKVRPVISLKNSTIVKGTGTSLNPYVITN